MISFDFEYYRPTSIAEAVDLFTRLDSQSKKPIYYAGGTEIISLARINSIPNRAVIDIKEIPECNVMEYNTNSLIIGSAVSLTKICEANLFPLLTTASRLTADHTSRNKITIGGNICGKTPYREAVLPFLLCDSTIITAGTNGYKNTPINELFNQCLKLQRGELLVQIVTDKSYLNLPFEHVKRTKQGGLDYPLITGSFLKKDNHVRAAISGLCAFPFRAANIENYINDNNLILEQRINNVMGNLPSPALTDIRGSGEYRMFVLKNVMLDVLQRIGGM